MLEEEFDDRFNEKKSIHFRDHLQFELKSEFFINPNTKKNIYKQEFFLFIPNTLQINQNTYSKYQFYIDQTNLIRYKTPKISLEELARSNHSTSPLVRLQSLIGKEGKEDKSRILDELKLFGNMFRRALRDRLQSLMNQLSDLPDNQIEHYKEQINALCSDLRSIHSFFMTLETQFFYQQVHFKLNPFFHYTNEFISQVIEQDLTYFLNILRKQQSNKIGKESDQLLCELILFERTSREKNRVESHVQKEKSSVLETILYRQGLLNKFMLEALRLDINRFSIEEKHGNLLGAAAAGVAMLIYMILFWQSSVFGVNSLPFILLIVVFYVLKDRVKEGIKNLYYRQAYRWFPDYSTEIRSPKGHRVGKLNESFSFIEEHQLPSGFAEIRNREFHEELQALQRPETIIQYKREVILHYSPLLKGRRRELTTFFRFNIHRFLLKASDALQPYALLDSQTKEIKTLYLPKIYHLNLIIRNTYLKSNLKTKIEIKKFRVILDKNGIKRVEQVP